MKVEKCTAYVVNKKDKVIKTIEGIQSAIWLNFLITPNGGNTLYVFDENKKLLYRSVRDNYGIPKKCFEDKGKPYEEMFKGD